MDHGIHAMTTGPGPADGRNVDGRAAGTASPLSVSERREGGLCVLEASGQVDLSNVSALAGRLMAAAQDPDLESVVVDLRRVDYMDSSGLKALTDARRALADRGHRMGLILAAGSLPDRALRVTGLGRILGVTYATD